MAKEGLSMPDGFWCKRLYLDGQRSSSVVHWESVGLDANRDGSVTVSDIGIWLEFIARMPVKFLLRIFDGTKLEKFLEIDCATGNGTFALLISIAMWIVLLSLVVAILTSKPKALPK